MAGFDVSLDFDGMLCVVDIERVQPLKKDWMICCTKICEWRGKQATLRVSMIDGAGGGRLRIAHRALIGSTLHGLRLLL